jgi:hypothetical protein
MNTQYNNIIKNINYQSLPVSQSRNLLMTGLLNFQNVKTSIKAFSYWIMLCTV